MNCNNNKNAASVGERAQLLLRERSCPGGLGCMDPAAVLHCECSSGWLQGEKDKGGEKEEQCSALDASKNQGYRHTGGDSVCQWQSTERRKTCSLLSVRRLSFPALMLLLEGNGTKTGPVHPPLTVHAALVVR